MSNSRFHQQKKKRSYPTTDDLVRKQYEDWLNWHPGDVVFTKDVHVMSLDSLNGKDAKHCYETLVDDYKRIIARSEPMPPIVIQLYPNERLYSIRDGVHRYAASKAAGMTHIPCLIRRTLGLR